MRTHVALSRQANGKAIPEQGNLGTLAGRKRKRRPRRAQHQFRLAAA